MEGTPEAPQVKSLLASLISLSSSGSGVLVRNFNGSVFKLAQSVFRAHHDFNAFKDTVSSNAILDDFMVLIERLSKTHEATEEQQVLVFYKEKILALRHR